MLIYNVTTQLDNLIANKWLLWMQQHHIPQVMATACFETYTMAKLLNVEEDNVTTYTVQYKATTMEHYTTYIDKYSATLRAETMATWGDKCIAYRSLMEVVN